MLIKPYPLAFILLLSCFSVLNSQISPVASLSKAAFPDLNYTILSTQSIGDSITILLTVNDNSGNFFPSMANPQRQHEYFSALLNETQKEVCKEFTVTEASILKSPVPIYISLVLDYSSSMKDDYRIMQSAIQDFIDKLPGVYFTRINFDEDLDLVESVPTRTPKPIFRDDFLRYGKGTALIAAIDLGIETLNMTPGPRFVIVFTDGQENSSGRVFGRACIPSTLVNNANKANTAIYGVGLNVGVATMVANICTTTNGQFFPVNSKAEMANVFKQIQSSLFNQFYVIKARCNDMPHEISVDKPDGMYKTTVVISEKKPWSDTTFFPIGFGRVQFELKKSAIEDEKRIKTLTMLTDRIVSILAADPKLIIKIEGHASPESGSDEMNDLLANQRALAVYSFMKDIITKKHDEKIMERIKCEGFGAHRPIFPYNSILNSENRRVELRGVH